MKIKAPKKIILFGIIATLIFSFPFSISAQETNEGYSYYQAGWEVIPKECIDPNTVDANGVIKRCDVNSFVQLFVNLANIMLKLSPPLAMIIVIYGGFRFLTSRGNQENVQSGKKVLVGAFIGMFLIIGFGWAISFFVVQTLTGNSAGEIFKNQAWWNPNSSGSTSSSPSAESNKCCVVNGIGCKMTTTTTCNEINKSWESSPYSAYIDTNVTDCSQNTTCQTYKANVNDGLWKCCIAWSITPPTQCYIPNERGCTDYPKYVPVGAQCNQIPDLCK